MRVEYEPFFAVHLHMHPRDVDRLTVEEFTRFCAYLDELNRRASA